MWAALVQTCAEAAEQAAAETRIARELITRDMLGNSEHDACRRWQESNGFHQLSFKDDHYSVPVVGEALRLVLRTGKDSIDENVFTIGDMAMELFTVLCANHRISAVQAISLRDMIPAVALKLQETRFRDRLLRTDFDFLMSSNTIVLDSMAHELIRTCLAYCTCFRKGPALARAAVCASRALPRGSEIPKSSVEVAEAFVCDSYPKETLTKPDPPRATPLTCHWCKGEM